MKMLLLEPDKKLAKDIVDYVDSTRVTLEAKIIHEEIEVYDDVAFLEECSIFVLNLKEPLNINTMRFIRENGNDAPILLICEKDIQPRMFKVIYYLSYNDIIVKDFSPEEIAFRIYKLCNLWNDDVFFINHETFYDFKKAIFVHNDERVHLGRKEAMMLKILFIKSPCLVTFDEIIYYVYQNEIVPHERIRSIIRELRHKLPIDLIQTKKGEGYQLVKY
jgi:DNA-binding response OmpR family regulator